MQPLWRAAAPVLRRRVAWQLQQHRTHGGGFGRQGFSNNAGPGAGPSAPGGRDLEYESPARRMLSRVLAVALPTSMAAVLTWGFMTPDDQQVLGTALSPHQVPKHGETIVNWSGTHEAKPKRYYQPENEDDVAAILAEAHRDKKRVRVVGSALSPNAIGFSDDAMMSMALLDNILEVDKDKMQVKVQAGCRVQQVADALKPHGLTLQNYASIREQQIGGFTQVSAHGTGATIPPVDEQLVAMKLISPALGTLELSAASNPELFKMARVGLGCLGVVTELTLQCVPAHQLVEHTFTADVKDIKRNHAKWLRENRHLRYMWLPYTDTAVVVQCNPLDSAPAAARAAAAAMAEPAALSTQSSAEERVRPLKELLLQKAPGLGAGAVEGLSATELRDALLVLDPLNNEWVAQVNQAEAEYWKRSSGYRVGWSDEILGFDCGGEQWVLEVAMPVGPFSKATSNWWWQKHRDIDYMQELLSEIDKAAVPAHSPIEQRWTASSSSPMSPAHDARPDTVHSWVGIIMYLPTEDPQMRAVITAAFKSYAGLVEQRLMPKHNAIWHWAKIEPPQDPKRLEAMRVALAKRYPLERFRQLRARLDPHNVLGNDLVDSLLGPPAPVSS